MEYVLLNIPKDRVQDLSYPVLTFFLDAANNPELYWRFFKICRCCLINSLYARTGLSFLVELRLITLIVNYPNTNLNNYRKNLLNIEQTNFSEQR